MSAMTLEPTQVRLSRYGAQSMTAPLRDVLLRRPGPAFARAFDDPAHGFRYPVDIEQAQREHDSLADLLRRLGARVHLTGGNHLGPDSVYVFDPVLVTRRGSVRLRPGKPSRLGEEQALEGWLRAAGVPTLGRVEWPGTVEGGDTLWLRPDLLVVGRSLRTNTAGAAQLASIVGGHVEVVDMPYYRGPSDVLHLLSVISPVSDDLAVAFMPLLPAGLVELLAELRIRLLAVDMDEFETLGCNVFAVRPGVVVVAEGNPMICADLAAAGCAVHTFPARQIGLNGSGGPTCLTRPLLRDG